MTTEPMDGTNLAPLLEALRRELAELRGRVEALEAASRMKSPTPPAAEEISEELILVLSAAVAAFLGKKAPIRQIRLVGSSAWAQQGRVIIQASHQLS